MALIVWKEDYSVGTNTLDADHIMIFSLINHIHEAHESGADETAIGHLLQVLMDRAVAHFQREEMLMKRSAYPDLDRHAAEHRNILEELTSMHASYRVKPDAELSREIIDLLCFWLETHILEVDMRYGPYLQGAGDTQA